MQKAEPVIELHFPLFGATEVPSNHAYPLYAAISHEVLELHSAEWLGIHSLRGQRVRPGIIRLAKNESLRLRLPLEKAPNVYKLSGAELNVDGHHIRCGVPTLKMLQASNSLRARLVIIKLAHDSQQLEPETFLIALEKQLASLKVHAQAELERTSESTNEVCFARRVLSIKNNIIPGYGVLLSNLTEDQSLVVQKNGLGGRRRMGCGLFVPIQQEISA